MAKVTEEYVRLTYLRNFRRMTYWQQQGIIEALKTVMDASGEGGVEQAPPLLRPANGEIEEPES